MKTDYDRIAEQWGEARKTLSERDRTLFERFTELLPENPRILDIGCGTGIPIARWLTEQGADLYGIDRSSRLLAMARENVPQAVFDLGDVETFTIDEKFDGAVLWDVIFHIERQKHRPILERIHRRLRPRGSLIVSSGGSEHPPFTDQMFGVDFSYDAHGPDTFIQICRDVGFSVAEHAILNEPDGGRDKGRIGLVLTRDGDHEIEEG